MSLFRRRPATSGHPITDFWTWWSSEGAQATERAIAADGGRKLAAALTTRVHAIHPALAWELGRGTSSQHSLTVTAGGDAAARPAAERWRRAAPAADATWEYRSSKEADDDRLGSTMEIGGHRVALDDMAYSVTTDDGARRVHVTVYNPAFDGMPPGMPEQIAFLALDWTVGEDELERWIGVIEVTTSWSAGMVDASGLRAAVHALAAQRSDDWALAELTDDDGTPGVAVFPLWRRWIDAPTLDLHWEIVADYAGNAVGLPDDAEGDRLAALEERLLQVLADRGEHLGRETSRSRRTFHVYTDAEDQNVTAAVQDFVRAESGVSATSEPDPGWTAVRAFTG